MKLKHFLVCATAWLAFGVAAAPASDATIEELFQVTHMESILNGMKAQMERDMQAGVTEMVAQENFTPEQRREIEQYATKLAAKFVALNSEAFSWQKMKQQFIPVYREAYTQEELKGMIAFYRSPLGRSVAEKKPRVAQRLMEIKQRNMVVLMPKWKTALQEALTEGEAPAAKPAAKAAE